MELAFSFWIDQLEVSDVLLLQWFFVTLILGFLL